MSWKYLVPTYFGSAWDKRRGRSLTVADLDWPNVGIYCLHEPAPWLLGSFEISAEVLEERGEAYWGWRRDFITGDGYVIQLGRQSGETIGQSLVGSTPYDRPAMTDAFSRALNKYGPLSPEANEISDALAAADRNLRLNVDLRCGLCPLSARFRSDSVQQVLSTAWAAGFREMTLVDFTTRVRRRPR